MPTVHLRFFDLARDREDLGAVPVAERERAGRFLREEDRRRYLIGRTAVRKLCGAFTGVAPAAVELRETEQGKPYLPSNEPDASQLHFNVAHSGDAVVLAWSVGGAVGVDVEVETVGGRERPFHAIAKTAFSEMERAVLQNVPEFQIKKTFFRIWTRKEAIVKAEGCGIAGALQRFSVAILTDAGVEWPTRVDFPENRHGWDLVDVPGPVGYAAAVAMVPSGVLSLETDGAFPPVTMR